MPVPVPVCVCLCVCVFDPCWVEVNRFAAVIGSRTHWCALLFVCFCCFCQGLTEEVTEATINFYSMDIELLFSSNPFATGGSNTFTYVKPNLSAKVCTVCLCVCVCLCVSVCVCDCVQVSHPPPFMFCFWPFHLLEHLWLVVCCCWVLLQVALDASAGSTVYTLPPAVQMHDGMVEAVCGLVSDTTNYFASSIRAQVCTFFSVRGRYGF